MSPRGAAFRQKFVKSARRLSEENSGSIAAAAFPSMLFVLTVDRLRVAAGGETGTTGEAGPAVMAAAANAVDVMPVRFSVGPPVVSDGWGCIRSRGKSRSAMPTISCRTSDSSDSKVICVLLGSDMETLTMFTLKRQVKGYPLLTMGAHRTPRSEQRQTEYMVEV